MKRYMMTLALVGALITGGIYSKPASANDTTVGTIIGAVGGGLLGSTLGKGQGRIVATAAGTVIGAVLGHEIAKGEDDYAYERPRRSQPTRVVYREVEREKTVYRPVKKHKQPKEWKRVAKYDGDVLICNKNGRRCHWYD